MAEKELFSQANSKYADVPDGTVLTFDIPSFITERDTPGFKKGFVVCPGAMLCARGCYALAGQQSMGSALDRRYRLLSETGKPGFTGKAISELKTWTAKRMKSPVKYVRIHDSGEFYSVKYFLDWLTIIREFPNLKFWTYSKRVPMVKNHIQMVPGNFRIVFSEGGWWDSAIDKTRDKFSRIFVGEGELKAAMKKAPGFWMRGDLDNWGDIKACLGKQPGVALVYHNANNKNGQFFTKEGKPSAVPPFTTDPDSPVYPSVVASEMAFVNSRHVELGWIKVKEKGGVKSIANPLQLPQDEGAMDENPARSISPFHPRAVALDDPLESPEK